MSPMRLAKLESKLTGIVTSGEKSITPRMPAAMKSSAKPNMG